MKSYRLTGELDYKGRKIGVNEFGDRYVRFDPGTPISTKQGWVRSDRVVAYEYGMLLNPKARVRHINGDRDDDRPENLEVLPPGPEDKVPCIECGTLTRSVAKRCPAHRLAVAKPKAPEEYRSAPIDLALQKDIDKVLFGVFHTTTKRMLRQHIEKCIHRWFSRKRIIYFSDKESIELAALYIDIAEGGEAGARAESEVVTLLAGKLGEAI